MSFFLFKSFQPVNKSSLSSQLPSFCSILSGKNVASISNWSVLKNPICFNEFSEKYSCLENAKFYCFEPKPFARMQTQNIHVRFGLVWLHFDLRISETLKYEFMKQSTKVRSLSSWKKKSNISLTQSFIWQLNWDALFGFTFPTKPLYNSGPPNTKKWISFQFSQHLFLRFGTVYIWPIVSRCVAWLQLRQCNCIRAGVSFSPGNNNVVYVVKFHFALQNARPLN